MNVKKIIQYNVSILWVGVAILVSVCIIYLTPLKHLNVIEPNPTDIDPATFWTQYQAHPDEYILFDVRGVDAYTAAHAKGAISQPIGNLFELHNSLPRHGKTIVLICSSGRLAGVAYGYLQDQGFLNILRIKGGLQNWIAEGLPVEGKNLLAPIPTVD